MFLLALNKLNLLPKNVIMVWDNPIKDIEWANLLWIYTILISSKNSSKSTWEEDYKKPNNTIQSLKEIIKIIEK
jgi:FMN phosphatase YigB (HAD superfamily)